MGKEWHFGGRSSRRATDATIDHHRRRHRPSLPGCMSTLFHFFDFHSSHFTAHFVFNKHHPSSFDLSHHPPLSKASHHGVEAPRNSLELDEASISCLRNKGENLQIQMGLQIKTRNAIKKSKASEQQLPNIDHIALESPSAKTPNLLARLMGLDILPQTSSPSSSRQQKPGACYHVSGTRSLPESPRVSSARLSDVDRHHRRLSLQINVDKENIKIINEEIKRGEEKVGGKVALVDITNNNRKLEYNEPKLSFSRSKVDKSSKRLKTTIVDESKSILRNQEVIIAKKQKQISMSMSMSRSKQKAKPREEAFGCPTSNNLLKNLNRTTILRVKKEPSPPAAKVSREQPCSYPKAKQKPRTGDDGERNTVGSIATTTDGGAAEFKYIKTILTTQDISMNCEVREDINVLIDKDLGKWKKFTFWRVAEIQGIVKVVEFHILDSLLRETTAAIYQNAVVF